MEIRTAIGKLLKNKSQTEKKFLSIQAQVLDSGKLKREAPPFPRRVGLESVLGLEVDGEASSTERP